MIHAGQSTRPATLWRALVLMVAVGLAPLASATADPHKVLRIASPNIETLDPQRYNDDPSYQVQFAIFEGLYEWNHLDPSRLSPNTATAMPIVTDNGRTWTIHVKPGIYFTPDAAFKGKRRELVAEDYVYTFKRVLDPALRGGAPVTADLIVGARPVVDAARKPGGKFDYDRPIRGLRSLDKYTLALELEAPNYPVIYDLITNGAVAREVVEAAGNDARTRAVGTGPFRLREWHQGSRMILEANPDYRTVQFPESGDPLHAKVVASMRGLALPRIGVIEIDFIEESTTRVLEFERGMLDYALLSGQAANRLIADGTLKPAYAAAGIVHYSIASPYVYAITFNMKDPVVGGLSNAHVGLRRAIAQALDVDALVRVVYAGQAAVINQLVPPGVAGFDAAAMPRSTYDPAAAAALLDRFGYDKRDAQGYRMQPDMRPLTLTLTSPSNASGAREFATLMKRNMDAIGVRIEFRMAPFQDSIKEVMAGRYQMTFGAQGGDPTGWIALRLLYGKSPEETNLARFALPEYDRAAGRFLHAASEAERIAAARTMSDVARNYAPLIPLVVQLENWFVQPWIKGFSPPTIQTHWKYLDIDLSAQKAKRATVR